MRSPAQRCIAIRDSATGAGREPGFRLLYACRRGGERLRRPGLKALAPPFGELS
jgi:hypothetical protein